MGGLSIASICRLLGLWPHQINMHDLTNQDPFHPSGFGLETKTAAIFLVHAGGGPTANGISNIRRAFNTT
jgi:hypothetical protein